MYRILYWNYIHVKSRDTNIVINKALSLAIVVNMEGRKELLSIWLGNTAGNKFRCLLLLSLRTEGLNKFMFHVSMGSKVFLRGHNRQYLSTY